MSIAFMPEIYPDELVYSWFCRYHVHSGNMTHSATMKDLYMKRSDNPSKEFIGNLNESARKTIEEIISIQNLILNHTMFPQYARFIDTQAKKRAFIELQKGAADPKTLFPYLPRQESDQHLKYCPICARLDRERYGETYWHREHQLRSVRVCNKHSCLLIETEVNAASERSYEFYPAEEYTINAKPTQCSEIGCEYSRFLVNIFKAPFDFEKSIPLGNILQRSLMGTKYASASGSMKYIQSLGTDLKTKYSGAEIGCIAGYYQIQRTLTGESKDFTVACQIAHFMEINASVLCSTTAEGKSKVNRKKCTERIDWQKYDEDMTAEFEKAAKEVYYGMDNRNGRPRRVSERIMYRKLNLPAHRLDNMPMCREILKKYSETYEENWARRIIWAFKKMNSNDATIIRNNICSLSGVKRRHLKSVIPYLEKYAGEVAVDKIISDFIGIIQ